MNRYRLFGLSLESDRPLDGLVETPEAGPADVRLTHEPEPAGLHWRQLPIRDDFRIDGVPYVIVHAATDGSHYRRDYYDGSRFVIDRRGRRILADPVGPGSPEPLFSMLQSVLGLVLRLRGTVALHGIAVAVGATALLLVGPPGAGKSTTSAQLALSGHAPLAEDLSALTLSDPGCTVHSAPAFPFLRLCPDAAEHLQRHANRPLSIRPPRARRDKHYLELDGLVDGHRRRTCPLAAIYLLGRRDDPAMRCQPLPSREALFRLMGHTWLRLFPDERLRAHEFRTLARLVQQVPVIDLDAPRDLDRLPALCDALLDDFGRRTDEPRRAMGG